MAATLLPLQIETGDSNKMGFTKRDCPGSKMTGVSSTTKSKPFCKSNLHHSLLPYAAAEKDVFSFHQSDDQSCSSSSSNCRNESTNLRCHQMGAVSKPGKRAFVISTRSKKENIDIEKQFETSDLVGKAWFDQSEGMWLSSGCLSPSLNCFEDHEFRDIWDFDYPLTSWNLTSDGGDLSIDNQFSPVMSSDGSSGFCFDGSRINPIEEASLVLDENFPPSHLENQITAGSGFVTGAKEKLEGMRKDCKAYLQSEETVGTWLYNSFNTNYSSTTCSEGVGSSCELSLYEDSSIFESSWTSVSIHEDSSPNKDLDRTGVWVSLLDLEDTDFEWISEKEPGFDIFPSDFPSPTYKSKHNSEVPPRDRSRFSIDADGSQILSRYSSDSSVLSLSDEQVAGLKCDILCNGTEGDFESFDSDEPLFWPFDPNSYRHAEIKLEGFFTPKSVKLKLPRRNTSYLQKKNRNIVENCETKSNWKQRKTILCKDYEEPFSSKLGFARKLVFRSRSTPSKGYENNSFRRINTIPSRICGTTQVSSQKDPDNLSKKQSPRKTKICSALIRNYEGLLFPSNSWLSVQDQQSSYSNKMKSSRNLVSKPNKLIHDDQKTLVLPLLDITANDYQQFLAEGFGSNENSIEALVGMNEFDGHEGIVGEFNKDRFLLDESVSDNLMEPLLIDRSCSDFSETNQSSNSLIYSPVDWSEGSVEGGENNISGCGSLGFYQNSVEADDLVDGKDEGEVAQIQIISPSKVSDLCKYFSAFQV